MRPSAASVRRPWVAILAAAVLAAGACSTGAADSSRPPTGERVQTNAIADGLFDNSVVHDVQVSFDAAVYNSMIEAYRSDDEKNWIEAAVTIDGRKIDSVGMRLKGNSSLRGLGGGRAGPMASSATGEKPEELPWLVRLDKYVDGQDHEGVTEFVIRANGSETSLNEAVALEVIGLAGEPTQAAFAARFSVNGSHSVLRLGIENPTDDWEEATFDGDGVLYKAESTGDYSYRGDDAGAYDEVFDQETDTNNEDLSPLIDFLKFINQSGDAAFAEELDDHLDVESFARYLALQDLVANWDDIDGPGNNSYLRYDEGTRRFTVVTWDLNLAFGGSPGGGRGGPFPGPPGGEGGARRGGPGGRSNILVERFTANAEYAALIVQAKEGLRAELFDSGKAAQVLDRWVELLSNQAVDLVDSATVNEEASTIRSYLS